MNGRKRLKSRNLFKRLKRFQTVFKFQRQFNLHLEVKFSIKSISTLHQEIDVALESEKIHIRMFSSIISKLFKNIY